MATDRFESQETQDDIDALDSALSKISGIYTKSISTGNSTEFSFTLKTFKRAGILFFGGANGASAIGCIDIETLGAYGGHGTAHWTHSTTTSVTTDLLTVSVSGNTVTVSGVSNWSYFTLISPLEFA